MDTNPEGSVYTQRYKVYDYPHVGIIDPRTRRLMWKKEGWTQQNPLTAEQFAEYAMDFCSRHSFDRPPQAPRPPSSGNGPKGLPAKRPMHEMSEEEQLQAAMRASLEDAGAGDGANEYEYEMDDDDDDDDDVVVVDSTGHKMEDDSKPKAIEKKEVPPPSAAPLCPLVVLGTAALKRAVAVGRRTPPPRPGTRRRSTRSLRNGASVRHASTHT